MQLTPWEPDLRTIVDRIELEDIDLQPDFQRQEIWPTNKKKKLIDTILRRWSIPPVFLVVSSEGRMDVLDGQQRLAAIRDFFANRFSIDGKITPIDPKIAELDGRFYRDLNPSDRRLVEQHTLRCFRITDYEPDEPSELFYRLNQPTRLTAGEQRNAFYGPAREQLKELVEHFEELGNAPETIGFSNARLAYDDIIARILFFNEAGTFAIKSTEAVISSRFREKEPFRDEVFSRVEKAIRFFSLGRAEAEPIKLNKASTISWLLFYSRYSGDEDDLRFMPWFLEGLSFVDYGGKIDAAVELFRDRSSLRVTDISSVVYRDFCLWLSIYVGSGKKTSLLRCVPENVLAEIDDELEKMNSVSSYRLENTLAAFLPLQEWAKIP